MSVSVFPAPATGGGGGGATTDIFSISGGIALVQRVLPIGLYAFKSQSNTSTEASGTVEFRDSSGDVITSITLVDSNTGGTSSTFIGSVYLTEEAAAVYYSGPSISGWLEMSYSVSQGATRILAVTTTTADFLLPFDATAYVFGGGGGAGSGGSVSGGGGGAGGSGYLETGSLTAGTYNAVIGAGGGQSDPASILSNGLPGGASSIGSVEALGGAGGLYGNNGATGGDGGSGGGAGRKPGEAVGYGIGGINGNDGGDNGTATGGTGSGVAQTLFYLPESLAGSGSRAAGVFYAGGNGGDATTNASGISALANSASGGGGGSRASGNPSAGSNGGSGVIYLVEA